jgi:cell division transport system permease protein
MISHILREILWYLRNEFTTTLTSFLGLFLSQLVFGLYLLILVNVWALEEDLRSEMTIEVFLKPDLTQSEMEEADRRIRNLRGVESVDFHTKEEALLSLREQLGEEVIRGLDENPLPVGYSLAVERELRNREGFAIVYGQLMSIPGIDEVIYGRSLLERLDKLKKLILYAGLVFGLITFLAVMMVVFGSSRLLVASRAATIEVMKLLGATRFYLRAPYLLMGLLSGLVASGLSLLLLYGVCRYLAERYIAVDFLSLPLLGSYLLWGATIAFLAALWASGRYVTPRVRF